MQLIAALRTCLPPRRVRIALAAVGLAAGMAVACAPRVSQQNAVHVLTADFDVNPVMERYIDRGIDEAERTDAKAVVIQLDTPGGLSTSMEHIVQRIEAANVPVIVYVAPSGAKAASAGTFITLSADIDAMAPGTSIGAAHPVDASGGDIEGTLGTKVENNAAAYARSIAEAHGRNADWAESAVRNSVSASANEAVDKGIVDYVAISMDDLLRQADGRTVTVENQPVTLGGLEAAPRVYNDATFLERLLLVLSDPNIAYLLLTLGGLGLLLEFLHPGLIAPGVFGAISLVLAFFVLGTLPVNWAGVALILLAFVLFAAELYVSGFGALGIGGAVALVAGGLILFSGNDAGIRPSPFLVFGAGFVCLFFMLTVVATFVRMRRMPARAVGAQAFVGRLATARSALAPSGFVFLKGERWKAVAEDGPIERGEPVEVTSAKGLTLFVRRHHA